MLRATGSYECTPQIHTGATKPFSFIFVPIGPGPVSPQRNEGTISATPEVRKTRVYQQTHKAGIVTVGDTAKCLEKRESKKMTLCREIEVGTLDARGPITFSLWWVLHSKLLLFPRSSKDFEVVGYLSGKRGAGFLAPRVKTMQFRKPHTNIFVLVLIVCLVVYCIQPAWESSRVRAEVQSET